MTPPTEGNGHGATRRSPIRVLLVDDHPMVREGLRSMLTGDGVEIAGEAGTGEEAIRLARALVPDLVLLDIELPDLEGITVLSRIKEASPSVPVLIVSMHDHPRLVRRAVGAGAAGYVLKGIGRRELLAAVRAATEGDSVLDPVLLRAVLSEVTPLDRARTPTRDDALSRAGVWRGWSPRRGEDSLTPVEHDVLRLMADGLTNRQISERMRWSVGTAKKYVQRVLDKLGVSDRTQAAVAAVRRGLLE
jgi:DNA-binding NarL/FixJ family response regulator